MIHYNLHQWLLFFFTYCFFGWVWESCYVSIRQRRWVNRGFLHGPFLPIYGTGAIIILWATLPVRWSLPLTFFLGMLSATVLEYCTGAAMERLFRVRYWDYSDKPLNLNGHICLGVSLFWGLFSLLLVKVLHPPIEALYLQIPSFVAEPLSFLLSVGVTVDAVQSVHAAMDLRDVLEKLTESSEDIRRIQKRLEVYSTFAQDDVQRLKEQVSQAKEELSEKLEEKREALLQEKKAWKLRRKETLAQNLQARQDQNLALFQELSERLERCRNHLEDVKDLSAAALAEKRAEITDSLERVRRQQSRLRNASSRAYARSVRILRGNPSAKAKQYAEALEELRKLGGMHRD